LNCVLKIQSQLASRFAQRFKLATDSLMMFRSQPFRSLGSVRVCGPSCADHDGWSNKETSGTSDMSTSPNRQPGEEVWRLRETATGRIQSCELRDDTKDSAGWNVQVLINGAPLFSRSCGDEWTAWFLVQAMKLDNMRGGDWIEDEKKTIEKGGV
jgi:hypothetical protein